MELILGIDIGGSTTKIVAVADGQICHKLQVRATDPVASLFGAFGKLMDESEYTLDDIDSVMITGVGSSFVNRPIYGIPTFRAEEFLCNGLGGLYLSGIQEAVIVSMGTGTAFVKACGDEITHLGGSGIGGGTLLGLSNRMLNVRDVAILSDMACEGSLDNIDLLVGDISKAKLPGLTTTATASNFGKMSDLATRNDIAIGIVNMVFQSIGVLSVFAARSASAENIVLIGNLTTMRQADDHFRIMEEMYGMRFVIPPCAEYATAVGAALAFLKSKKFECVAPAPKKKPSSPT